MYYLAACVFSSVCAIAASQAPAEPTPAPAVVAAPAEPTAAPAVVAASQTPAEPTPAPAVVPPPVAPPVVDPPVVCPAPQPLPQVDPNAPFGFIHDIVGKDGALMLTLARTPERFAYASAKLKEAGIIATPFPAADAKCEAKEDLLRGCFLEGDRSSLDDIKDELKAKNSWGWGCMHMANVACTESHHRALEAAQFRASDWTLIMEDDAVPIDPANFDASFKAVWPKIPSWAKFVRLGFCDTNRHPERSMTESNLLPEYLRGDENEGTFRIVHMIGQREPNPMINNSRAYDAGMCMTAYMVHRRVLPDVLGVFPCGCIIDCCLAGQLFDKPVGPNGEPWGEWNMVSIDINNQKGVEMSVGWNKLKWMIQYGPIVQDNREIVTTRIVPGAFVEEWQSKSWARKLTSLEAEIHALGFLMTKVSV